MIAQVVFDLPLEGYFDYAIPQALEARVMAGMRVEATLGFRKAIGLVISVMPSSTFDNLKIIRSLIDQKPLLDQAQLALGQQLSEHYGCSLGDALFTIVRSCEKEIIAGSLAKIAPSLPSLHLVPSGNYSAVLTGLIEPLAQKKQRVLILVADQFAVLTVEKFLATRYSKEDYVIGMRSAVFRSLTDIGLVIMMDEDNTSFKQEQTPMYDTRDVLLMRAKNEKMDVAFVSTTPTVEMMRWVQQGLIKMTEYPSVEKLVKPQIVDLNTYKIMIKGLLSPALLSPLESNLAKKLKSILVFNHRGSYAMTRCTECGFVLKCQRCDSPVVYSRIKKEYLCRYCSFHLAGDTQCPTCKRPSWKSFGLGVEQLQKALQDKYPLAKIASFERGVEEVAANFDILIGTSVLLRFKNKIKVDLVAFLDIDSELNRLDMRSCFRAWSMVGHLRGMAKSQLLIQTRQPQHYVMKSLGADDTKIFYDEDMAIRRELGFSPFAHQISIYLRGKEQPTVEKMAQELYHLLTRVKDAQVRVSSPQPEVIVHKRGQYRLNILVQGADVVAMIAQIKQALGQVKRRAKVIVTINVDA